MYILKLNRERFTNRLTSQMAKCKNVQNDLNLDFKRKCIPIKTSFLVYWIWNNWILGECLYIIIDLNPQTIQHTTSKRKLFYHVIL